MNCRYCILIKSMLASIVILFITVNYTFIQCVIFEVFIRIEFYQGSVFHFRHDIIRKPKLLRHAFNKKLISITGMFNIFNSKFSITLAIARSCR